MEGYTDNSESAPLVKMKLILEERILKLLETNSFPWTLKLVETSVCNILWDLRTTFPR